jgi:hypothetical protein
VVIDQLKTLLQPVDWADTLGAEKQFRRTMEEIGRLLNHAGHTIGNIKLADEVTSFLLGANEVLGAIGNLLTLNDYRRFLSGELTNQEAARAAISCLLGPAALVPGLGPEIVEWYAKNVPNPNGHWHGFVAPVE